VLCQQLLIHSAAGETPQHLTLSWSEESGIVLALDDGEINHE